MKQSYYLRFNLLYGIFVCWTLYLWYESPGLWFMTKTGIVVGNLPLLFFFISESCSEIKIVHVARFAGNGHKISAHGLREAVCAQKIA